MNLILINYKIKKIKKNKNKNKKVKSHILNKNHHTIKITTHFTLIKITKKKKS